MRSSSAPPSEEFQSARDERVQAPGLTPRSAVVSPSSELEENEGELTVDEHRVETTEKTYEEDNESPTPRIEV